MESDASKSFSSSAVFGGTNGEKEIVYDVDTFTVVERVLLDRGNWRKKVWKDGKIKTYTLKRDGGQGILRKSEDWLQTGSEIFHQAPGQNNVGDQTRSSGLRAE